MSDTVALARGVIVAGVTGSAPVAPHFGGYILFPEPNASLGEVRALTDSLRARGGTPAPVIAIDQEGGAVARLRDGVEPIPSMMAVGAAHDIELARCAGAQIGFDLRRAGCTLDCAPVLDLALEPENAVIGTRSFGADPRRVARACCGARRRSARIRSNALLQTLSGSRIDIGRLARSASGHRSRCDGAACARSRSVRGGCRNGARDDERARRHPRIRFAAAGDDVASDPL